MTRAFVMVWLCAASTLASAHADTFVIEADKDGHEATIKIPAGAVMKLSANRAESLDGYAGSQIEAMRLSGDVLIGIAGSASPIEIKADSVVVELTADSAPAQQRRGRAAAATNKVVRSPPATAANGSQVFVGNVEFDLQTASGPMQIKADRVEHQLDSEPGV